MVTFEAGCDAFHSGISHRDNPYGKGLPEYREEWFYGWDFASQKSKGGGT